MEDGLIYNLLNLEQDILNSSSDETINGIPATLPTLNEAKDAIKKIVQNFFGRGENSNNYFLMINGLESNILEVSTYHLKL